ncbi:MAG: 50S ribosomal protein L15, partial [bacterium]|nr:50S ribosomal protein L15 [bacterium]
MQLHELKRKTPNQAHKRVGRGGGRGKTSGRGTKG